MAYHKRRSTAIEQAQTRLRGLQAANLTIDLGNGLTLQYYADLIDAANARLQSHNQSLAEADRTRIELIETEEAVSALSSRILSAIAGLYGRESKEYQMAGGKPLGRSKRVARTDGTLNLMDVGNGNLNGSSIGVLN